MLKDSTKWYASWFDTPYYHTLYKDRNDHEAKDFMNTLTQYLKLSPTDTIMDLACGKGRHSIHLNSLGYDVTGVDLSQNSITHASQFENESLRFAVHDMCLPYTKQFDAVFNLFTSFGYFENEEDNLRTIQAIKSNLKPQGVGVIDFMNATQVLNTLIPEENKVIDQIDFKIKRYLDKGFIHKEIRFTDQETSYHFTEKVKALTLQDFKSYFEKANLKILDIFGNYELQPFEEQTSPRLILIFT